MNRSFFLLFLLIALPNLLFSQITTDRPDQTESPTTISEGNIQVESGIAIEKEQSNVNTLFRFGMFNGVELRLNSNYLINDQMSSLIKSSFTDFEVGAKFRIQDDEDKKTKIGFLTHISIPTAPEIFSNNEYGLLNRFIVSHDISESDQIAYNIGYNKFKNYGGELVYTLVYSKGFNSFGMFIELFGNESSDLSILNFDSGITYQLDKNKQLDISFAKGLNNELFYFSIGYSISLH